MDPAPSNAVESAPIKEPITVVNVLGVSYTGTTWCSLMLGAAPHTFCIGEFDRVRKMRRAHCTLHGDACDFWGRFDAANSENVFHQIARLADRRILVVTNSKRFASEQRDRSIRRAYVLIIRDGRSFLASARRKHHACSSAALAWEWTRDTVRRYRRMLSDVRARSVVVRYESLQSDTEAQLVRICEAIGIPFHTSMLDYTHAAPHYLGGNAGTLSVLARKNGLNTLYAQRHDKSIWELDLSKDRHVIRDGGQDVVVDHALYRASRDGGGRAHQSRWMNELTRADLRQFHLVGGWLNRCLGYRRHPAPPRPPSTV